MINVSIIRLKSNDNLHVKDKRGGEENRIEELLSSDFPLTTNVSVSRLKIEKESQENWI